METVYRNPATLVQADYNPRRLSKTEATQIRKSLESFGFVQPIVVNTFPGREGVIVGGNQRAKVAIDMGMESVPCWEVCLDPQQEKEANVRLNKAQASWDFQTLSDMASLEELLDWGFTAHELGLNADIDGLKEMEKRGKKEDKQSDGDIPLFLTLNGDEHDTLESYKARTGIKNDKEAIFHAIQEQML